MYGANQVGGNGGAGGIPPNPGGSNQNQPKVSHVPDYSRPFNPAVAERQSPHGQFTGVSGNAPDSGLGTEHEIRIVHGSSDLTNVQLPTTHPAERTHDMHAEQLSPVARAREAARAQSTQSPAGSTSHNTMERDSPQADAKRKRSPERGHTSLQQSQPRLEEKDRRDKFRETRNEIMAAGGPLVTSRKIASSPLQSEFTSVVIERKTDKGKELGIVCPPGSGKVFGVGTNAAAKLLFLGQSVTIKLDNSDKPYVHIPAAYPANISGLVHVVALEPALEAQREVRSWKRSHFDSQGTSTDQAQMTRSEGPTSGQPLWTSQSFQGESAKHDWCADLDELQSAALLTFMNRARVSSFDDVGSALQPALFGSHRLGFEAACAVYASGVGDITEQDHDGNTCLHTMVRVHDPDAMRSAWADIEAAQGVPPLELHERFAEAIRLGADPFVKNNAGKSTIDLAAEQGCLVDLIRGMSESLPAQEVDRVLAWKDDKQRNILSAMATVGEGLADVRKLVARKFCEDFVPKLSFEIASDARAEWETLQKKVSADWDHQLDNRQISALARFMKEARLENASPSEVADDLPLALTTGLRPAFEAARAVYASGVCDINDRNEEDHTCLHDLSLGQNPSASLWGYKSADHADVSIEERLAVMMQLGADPFSTGEDGKLPSAEQLAIERGCEALMKPFADLKSTLKTMNDEFDGKNRSAWANSTSAEAVDFFHDLGIKAGSHAFDEIKSPMAISRWLRRNPNRIESRVKHGLFKHALDGASVQVIGAYVDAITSRPSFDPNYQGDVNFDLRVALGWSKSADDLTHSNPGSVTLFNCSSSIESAKMLLVTRLSARSGERESEWENFSSREWQYLLGNVEANHPKQHVSSIDLAALLLEHGVFPPNEVLSGATAMANWRSIREKVDSRNEATNLWGKVIQGEKSAKELSKAEWAVMAPHAHRMLADVPFDKFKTCMTPLMNHLASITRCDQATRIAFLKVSYEGKQALGDSNEKEMHRKAWDLVVGRVGFTFRYREHGSLSGAGILGEARTYTTRQSDDVYRKENKR